MGASCESGVDDEIILTIPAKGDYGRIVRIAGASLSLLLGFPMSRLDDLRLAVDESLIMLLGSTVDADDIEATFFITDHALGVRLAAVGGVNTAVADVARGRFAEICGGIIDEWSVDSEPATVHLVLLR